MDDELEDGEPLFEMLLDARSQPNRAVIHSNFGRLKQEYDSALKWIDDTHFGDQTSSEELTGNIKLRILESMEEINYFEEAIGKALLELEHAQDMLKDTRLNFQRGGLDRIQRILQYRRTYGGRYP